METVIVKVAAPKMSQVVLWERHPGHPAGEVFLVGEGEFEVALTPAVKVRLQDGRLVVAEASAAGKAAAASKAAVVEAVAPVAAEAEVDAPVAADESAPEPAAKSRKRAARKGGL